MSDVNIEIAKGILCSEKGMLEHILLDTVVCVVIAVFFSYLFGTEHDWKEEFIEYTMCGIIGGILMVLLFCEVILK